MNPQSIIETIKTILRNLAGNGAITLEFFSNRRADVFSIFKLMQPEATSIDELSLNNFYDTAVKEYTSVYPIEIDPSSALTKENFQTWLTDERKQRLSTDYIDRYLRHLRNEGRSENVISELERSSESILSKLGDPQSTSAFYTKGLVVGSVQSGKTGNFNAVINRAIDAGYNLIIILSGIMEDLRSQTQLRLESDVIGEGLVNFQTEQIGPVGVGKVTRFGIQGNSEVQIPQVFSITSHRSDFKKEVQDASFSLNHKNLLVCKKNTGVLKNLLVWLSDYLAENSDQHNIPLLIVDDEADNASLNNLGHKGREYASTINGHIRAILGLFSRKTYLGYTATPFANVLQDRNEEAEGQWAISFKRNGELITKNFTQVDNIFPNDFIELLTQPSNYIGARQIFDTSSDVEIQKIPLVEPVTDSLASFPEKVIDSLEGVVAATRDEIDDDVIQVRSPRKDDLFPAFLPESLIGAIECFVLAIAIRLKRRPSMVGSKLYIPHNTMLIHVSRFTDWQNRTRNLVQDELTKLTERINNELPSASDSIYGKLEKTWNKYYAAIVENIRTYLPVGYADDFLDPVLFEDIKPLLPEAVKNIDVKAINSVTKEKLVYQVDSTGNGKKYIAIGGNRLSRGFTLEGLSINYFIRNTNYADTLLQMGRWFGYRPGYIDCCKLFTTWDAIDKFDAVTRTIEELEIEFKKMHRKNKTPNDFILRVKTHPGVLKITRPSILKNTEEVNWSYQDTLVQTTQFNMDGALLENSWTDFKELVRTNDWRYSDKGFYLTDTDVPGLYRFLDSTNTFHDYGNEIKEMKAFINLCQAKDKLKNWRIAIKATGTGSFLEASESGLPKKIQLSVRSGPGKKSTIHRKQLEEKGIFTGSGKSANILSGGRDMALWLEEDEIRIAEREFEAEKAEELKEKYGEAAEKEAKKKTKPERIYREKMTDNTGLLVIYLMDTREIFNVDGLSYVKEERGIDDAIPLIGYAIGFPKMSSDIGGVYVRGKYSIDEDEPESEEFDEEGLNSLDELV